MTSHGSIPFAQALQEVGWDIPRVIAGGSFGAARAVPELFVGWVGTALWDPESNPRCRDFLARYDERFGPQRNEDMLIAVYDGARALLEGISLAPIMTREGVRQGMEKIKMLPATTGGPTSIISFGPYDHRGYSGRDLSILRMQRDTTIEGNVKVGYYEPI